MYIPSITTILGSIFLVYIAHSMWQMSQLFSTLKCSSNPCYKSYLASNPKLQLALFTSSKSNPIASETKKILGIKNFNYFEMFERDIEIDIPLQTRRNGSLYMQVVLALNGESLQWKTLKRDGPTVIHTLSLTDYAIPQVVAFNLLGDSSKPNSKIVKPVTHFTTQTSIVMLTDSITLSSMDIPPELARLIRINRKSEFLPVIQTDFFKSRLRDLTEVTKDSTGITLKFNYSPIGIGKLRLMLLVEHTTKSMNLLGFSKKDVDEVKQIFLDTNMYLLCGTVFVGSIHMLFDFLSFKNDVMFWRKKTTYAGLSTRTILWRAFSQIVVFLYLMDENTSLLVLIPAGIGALIEIWKCKKILKIEVGLAGIRKKQNDESKALSAEEKTQAHDREAMRYLSYLLYPLCVCGAIYSLIYQPHKSWWSWTLNSLVNGVYAFGFLFMLPQLFVNYKLKSVAALPWRSFMYKAFNTFIDDIFAFIITMPTAHRVACFRDDIVFLIYLYQRYLYPVDKNRLDTGVSIEDTNPNERTPLTTEDKKTQ